MSRRIASSTPRNGGHFVACGLRVYENSHHTIRNYRLCKCAGNNNAMPSVHTDTVAILSSLSPAYVCSSTYYDDLRSAST